MRQMIIIALLCGLLVACGQTGALYLPKTQTGTHSSASTQHDTTQS